MQPHSSIHPLAGQSWVQQIMSGQLPRRTSRSTLQLIIQLLEWYMIFKYASVPSFMLLLLLEYDGAACTCFQVITAAGNVKHEDIVALADKMFNKLSTDPTTTSMLVAQEPASFTGSEVCFVIFTIYLSVPFVMNTRLPYQMHAYLIIVYFNRFG